VAVSGAVLIDLGEDWSVAEELPPRRRARPARAPLVALVLVAVVLLAGGSAAVRPPFTPLASFPVQGVTATEVGGGGVFVVVQVSDRRSVSRYALDGSGRTWEATVPNMPEGLAYLPAAGVLVVWSFDVEVGPARFVVLDASTGERLWGAAGDLVLDRDTTARSDLLLVDDGNGGTEVRYTDMRTGRALWSRMVPAMTQMLATGVRTPPGAGGFVLAAADGTVTLLAEETGKVLATRQFDRLVPAGAPGFDPENNTVVNVVGGELVIVRQMGTPRAVFSAYDLPGLTRRWTLADPEVTGYPDACGTHLCVSGSSGAVVALDPATGAILWRAPGWQGVTDLDDGRLLGFRTNPGEHGGILDADSGRVLRDLGDWTQLSGPGDGYLFTAPDPGNYRYTWFGALDLERAAVVPLGRIAGLSTQGCQVYGDLMVCRTLDARLRVWRYRG
jgi:outer membrane protein assembly factor BamB